MLGCKLKRSSAVIDAKRIILDCGVLRPDRVSTPANDDDDNDDDDDANDDVAAAKYPSKPQIVFPCTGSRSRSFMKCALAALPSDLGTFHLQTQSLPL